MPKKRPGISKDQKRNTWMISNRITLPNGKVIYIRKRGFLSEKDAFIEMESIKAKLLLEFQSEQNKVDWEPFCKDYWKKYSSTVKNTTAHNWWSSFRKNILSPFNDKTVAFVFSCKTLTTFRNSLIERKELNTDSKNRVIKCIKNMLSFAYDSGYISPEEFRQANVSLVNVGKQDEIKKEKVIWTQEQYKSFLQTFEKDDRFLVFFELFGHLGCRISEIRGLQIKHWSSDKKEIFICQQATNRLGIGKTAIISPKTSSSNRVIQISDRINQMLIEYVTDLGLKANDFFFGSPPVGTTTIRRIFVNHTKMANLPIMTIHGIRHSNTTWLLSKPGISLIEISKVSKRLGHSSKKVTLDIYFHLITQDQDDILKTLD